MSDTAPQLQISFTNLHADGPLAHDSDLLLRVGATLRITIGDRLWFEEPNFPVVEFGVAIAEWLRAGGDFNFTTLEANESPFICVASLPEGCKVSAAWQEYEEGRALDCTQVVGMFREFVEDVRCKAGNELGVNITSLFARIKE